ncbi:MAG: Crp/Fnr family transcriptional regulator [Chloroflexi bacterium]|nr:Crp/Fnr family transcriptional regulator [Chloroflexota bacterium]
MQPESLLRRIPLFDALSEEALQELGSRVRRRRFRNGDVIFHKDDPGSTLYLLESGQVKVYVPTEDGKDIILAMLMPGQFFGELSLLDNKPRSATAAATEETVTLILERDDLFAFLRENPDIALRLLEVIAARLRQTDSLLEDIAFLDIDGRLAKRLLDLSKTFGQASETGTTIELRLTQEELAAMIGATRESVAKRLGYYRRRGFITIENHRITILRPQELARRVYP